AGIGWLQDISPNHMAYHPGNKWLTDVLKNGRDSQYSGYFDIDWDHPLFQGKLQAPFLSTSPDEALEHGDLTVIAENGELWFRYGDRIFPLNRPSSEQ